MFIGTAKQGATEVMQIALYMQGKREITITLMKRSVQIGIFQPRINEK
ncbi:conserved hypothetical protein (plasmid) [Bacillus cereus AH820]|uniref:Uncharacterized protein n=2 Tax=Bacillus cereus TaxID=1396 RepID=A1BZH5_BACCE|nr:hypothetical protein [Bacillus cereus]ABK00924.1 hypothetical protein pPER272_AH820_0146 [Bacillus cereus]ABK01189.1 hypothetical protein pPER272_0146 [Bacillus cereus]ACK92680.1 conserved hypothetical protein [Bacillus cereus AH820]